MGNQSKAKRIRLDGRPLEIILRRARDGKLSYRVGEILRVPQVSGETILLLDYDQTSKPRLSGIRFRLSEAGVRLLSAKCRRSPSGHGWHVITRVHGKWNRYQRIALQALLESDPTREAQNFYRAQIFSDKEWSQRGNVLFTNRKA